MLQELSDGGSPLLIVPEQAGQRREMYFACKRGLDLIVAAIALLILSPVMLAIGFLIRLDSPGSSLFIQERVGARRRSVNGRTAWQVQNFRSYKFRTMMQNADPKIHQAHVQALARAGSQMPAGEDFKLRNDPRVTRVGRFLRKTSLDEVPQLVNVLKGEMSLVGPRPVPPYEVAEYQPWQRERLAALPGITGQWQVHGRGRVTFDDMIRMDIEYVRHPSLWTDLKLLVLTVPAVLSRRGAH